MSLSGIQAIVLAAGRGSRIPELVSSQPKCLLPIGNRPMIYYPLHALDSVKFTEVTVVVNEGQEEAVNEAILNQFSMRINLFSLPVKDEDYGTADTLRLMHEEKKILSDFLVISCDIMTNFPLYKLINAYRVHDAAITVLVTPTNIIAEGSTPGKKGKPEIEKDLIGIDHLNDDRLVFFNSELEFDEDVPFTISMLKRCPQFTMHNSYLDTHVYVMKKWVLGYIKEKRQIRSIKADLIPRLVRKQFKSYVNIVSNKTTDDLDAEKGDKVDLLDYVETDEVYKALEALEDFNFDHEVMKTTPKTKIYPESAVKCQVLMQKEGISLRANTVTGFFEANKRIRALFPDLPKKEKGSVPTTPTTPNPGPAAKTQIGADCLVSTSSRIGDKTSVKRSVIGDHCNIGEKAKIANCVLMNHVTIEDNCNIQGSIICDNAIICASAEIKDCIVVANHKIVTYGKFSNEVIPSTFVDVTDD